MMHLNSACRHQLTASARVRTLSEPSGRPRTAQSKAQYRVALDVPLDRVQIVGDEQHSKRNLCAGQINHVTGQS
jgi:hypothetical protein